MINAIFAHYDDQLKPGKFIDKFYIFYSNQPSKCLDWFDALGETELNFIRDSTRENRCGETCSGMLYLAGNLSAQNEVDEERDRLRKLRTGYHQPKKRRKTRWQKGRF